MSYLSGLTLGRYLWTGSVVHRLDPRTKLLSTLVLISAGMALSSAPPLLALLGMVFAAGAVARLRPGLLLSNLRPLVWLLVLMVSLNAVLTPGRVLVEIPGWGLGLTDKGLRLGFFFALRLTVLVLLASLLTLTTSPLDLADGMERLLGPTKRAGVPVHELAMTLTIALRFVPTLADEADRLRQAQRARGADLEGGLVRRLRGLISLVVPLFLSAFRRAERLALAMESRCYRGEEGRTSYARLGFRGADGVAGIVVAATGAVLWCLR